VWSVTSWTELRREALATDEWNRRHHDRPRRIPYLTRRLKNRPGPIVAVSDWMRAVPDQIAPFVPGTWTSLGTDGFGRSDTRAALRRHRQIDAPSIVLRVLGELVDRRELDRGVLSHAIEAYDPDDLPSTAGRSEGPSR
jgi:pyruvate dehydrogenase E1 component